MVSGSESTAMTWYPWSSSADATLPSPQPISKIELSGAQWEVMNATVWLVGTSMGVIKAVLLVALSSLSLPLSCC
jgi:hypothetical protein